VTVAVMKMVLVMSLSIGAEGVTALLSVQDEDISEDGKLTGPIELGPMGPIERIDMEKSVD
jgi:hypothetical protein